MDDRLSRVLTHINQLLKQNSIPPLENDLKEIPELMEIHNEIKTARETLSAFSGKYAEDLSALTESLCREIEKITGIMEALHENESRLKYLANHDPLTGTMNRHSFMERAEQELNDAFRHNISCGLIMIDIDYFKNFNDTYGHQAGDEALRHIVRIIGESSRSHDFLGRYGGEEFIFFFCHADKEAGFIIGERMRTALEKAPVQLDSGPAGISACFGIALAKKPDNFRFSKIPEYLETLIHNADTALYLAKRNGRNRVIIYEENTTGPDHKNES